MKKMTLKEFQETQKVNCEFKDLLPVVEDTFRAIANNGFAYCRFCDFKAYGDNYGEILEKLGKHGESIHPELMLNLISGT